MKVSFLAYGLLSFFGATIAFDAEPSERKLGHEFRVRRLLFYAVETLLQLDVVTVVVEVGLTCFLAVASLGFYFAAGCFISLGQLGFRC